MSPPQGTGEGTGSPFAVVRAPRDPELRRGVGLAVVDHLALNEAENNLAIGVAMSLSDGSLPDDDAELLLARDPTGRAAAALVMTPPYRLIVGLGDDPEARAALLRDLRERRVVPPGVVGPEPASGEVVRWWARSEGLKPSVSMRQRVFSLDRVTPSERTAGTFRPATEQDASLLLPWLRAFFVEARIDVGSPEGTLRAFTTSPYRRLYLFEADGRVVSFAGVGARTPRGRRIGPVYTPPEHRRHGYAEALVAQVSAAVLGQGSSFCFLFTDLDNPTSNAIYERIGYRRVVESTQYDLAAPPGP